ncbi:hypothetical protein SAY87_000807 [Trapa incisa]|uniref:Outer envelope membrane protein 7 n=2 Tax=Trapa TaxID=22665 RepID=A0AAN7RFN1_TRANT|nr:hypothetical protein SAY87_000807 [Trapa incisa]KAK4800975.1 hypothetical protein SAY86_021462 [Trapa natans]
MGKSKELKQAAVVFGALAFGWLAIEMAFRPLLNRARAAMDRSDPERDPDVEVSPSERAAPIEENSSASLEQ